MKKKIISLVLTFLFVQVMILSAFGAPAVVKAEGAAFTDVEFTVYPPVPLDGEDEEPVEPVEGTDYAFKILLPEGYNARTYRYPVLYLMPSDGYTADQYVSDGIPEILNQTFKSGEALSMIVVVPTFKADDEVYETLDAIIAYVDENYATIADPNFRAVAGTETGAYLAFLTAHFDETMTQTKAVTRFSAVLSMDGDFTSENNPWLATYGNLYEQFALGSRDTWINSFFTYLDANADKETAWTTGGTESFANRFNGSRGRSNYNVYEYNIRMTARYGTYANSLPRALGCLAKSWLSKIVSGSLTIHGSHVLTSDRTEIPVTVNQTINDESLAKFFTDRIPAKDYPKLTVTLTDPENDDAELYSDSEASLPENDAVDFVVPADKKADGTSTGINASIKILGVTYDLASEVLVVVQDPITSGDDRMFDLMGDWYFMPYKAYRAADTDMDHIDYVMQQDYTEWYVVQPCLGWWTSDFVPYSGWGQYWTGYAWYLREFDVPEGFDCTNLIIEAGMFDEADEIYVNGVFVGSTGIATQGGNYDGSNPWDVERVYTVPDNAVKVGKNVIAIRTCNSSGGGGWYTGPVALYSQGAYNKIGGYPYISAPEADAEAIKELVAAQNAALKDGKFDEYIGTVSNDYFQSGKTRYQYLDDVIAEGPVEIVDSNANVYTTDDGLFCYQTERSIDGAAPVTTRVYFTKENGEYKLCGDHARYYVAEMYSPTRKATVSYEVYLPECYFDDDTTRYPVTIMMHGINSTGLAFKIAGVPELLDEAIAEGAIEPTIVIFPNSPTKSSYGGNVPTVINKEMLGDVDTHLRTTPDRRFRGVAGESLGGGAVHSFTNSYPDQYSWAIDLYGSGTPNANATKEYLSSFNYVILAGNHDSYRFDNGKMQFDQRLQARGVERIFEIEDGEHSATFFMPRLKDAFIYAMKDIPEINAADDAIKFDTFTADRDEEGNVILKATYTFKGYEDLAAEYIPGYSATAPKKAAITVPINLTYNEGTNLAYTKQALLTITEDGEQTCELTIPAGYLDAEIDGEAIITADLFGKTFKSAAATWPNYELEGWTWAEDYKTASAKFVKVNDPADVQEIEAEVTEEITTAPTCEEDGEAAYTAVVNFDDREFTDAKTAPVPALGHAYDEGTWEWVGSDEEGYTAAKFVIACANDAAHNKSYVATVAKNNTDDESCCALYIAAASVDGELVFDTKEVKLAGHVWGEPKWTWSADNSEAKVRFVCNNCGVEKVIKAAIAEEVTTEPEYGKPGVSTFTATAELDGETYTDVKEAEVPFTGSGLFKDEELGYVYLKDGEIDAEFSEPIKSPEGWIIMTEGKFDGEFTGMAKNAYGWYYFTNGKLDKEFEGPAKNAYGWWYIKGGKIDRTFTGLAKNQYGWFYFTDGRLDKTYTGIGQNAYGNWFVTAGKLDKTFNGSYVDKDGVTWKITNGKAKKA